MLSTTDCVNQIQSLLDAGGEVAREQVAELVWAYAAYCRRVDHKARQCLDLLRQGRRNEARKLAKQSPDVEQELNLLDFPEREDWLDLCEGAGLPIRQSLDTVAVRAIIQEVYGDGGRMEQLLRTFRRMSLGQAPLADRLRILRSIRRADPDRDFWEDAVRNYEVARLEELMGETNVASARGDLAAIEQVLGELGSGDWLTSPTAHVNAVEKVAGPHRRRHAYDRFQRLLEELHQAHAEMDEDRCRSLLAEWQDVVDRTGVAPQEEMKSGVAPIRAWLGDRDAAIRTDLDFHEACAQLEKAIDDDREPQKLEQLAAEVFRFERGMPELLAAKFSTRMGELKSRSRRRFALALTGIVGGLLLLAAAVTFVVISQTRRAELEGWHGRIAAALKQGDLDSARKMLDGLRESNPDLVAAAEIVDLRVKYEKMVDAERLRSAEFEQIRQRIEERDPEDPDKTGLARATELARGLEETQWVRQWELKYEEALEQARRRREEAFRERLAELRLLHATFSEAERESRPDLEQYIQPVLELSGELLKAQDVSDALLAQVRPIHKHAEQALRDFQASAEERKTIDGILAELPSIAAQPERLEQTLSAFVEKYGDHRLASDFARAGRMAPHWRASEAWRALASEWSGRLRLDSPSAAASRAQRVEAHLQQFPGGPFSAALQDYLAYLKAADAAFSDGRLVGASKVQDILSHVIFTPALRMIRTRRGDIYYVLEKDLREQLASGRVIGYDLNYITSMNLIYARTFLDLDLIAEGPVTAPQVAYRDWASERLTKFQGPGWETFYLELAAQATEHHGMDPVLTGQLLQLLLGYAASSSPFEVEWIRRLEERVTNEGLDFVEWLDPKRASSTSRWRARELLTNVDSPAAVLDAVSKKLVAMERALQPYQLAGVLLGQSARVHFSGQPPDGALYALWSREGESPTFQELGEVRDATAVVAEGMADPFPDGTPVFVRQEPEVEPEEGT